jgi:Flp pilus assembly pilin Flp
MLTDRRGAELVEWIVMIVIVLSIVGTAVYGLFQTIGGKFDAINNSIH